MVHHAPCSNKDWYAISSVGGCSIVARTSHADPQVNAERSALHVWTESCGTFVRTPFPLMADQGVIAYKRHGNDLLAIIRKEVGGVGKDLTFVVELWDTQQLLRCYPTKDVHGAIYPQQNSTFGGLCFSPCGKMLLYTAEIKPTKTCSWWDSSVTATNEGDGPVPGQKVRLSPKWFAGMYCPFSKSLSCVNHTFVFLSSSSAPTGAKATQPSLTPHCTAYGWTLGKLHAWYAAVLAGSLFSSSSSYAFFPLA